MFFNQNLTIKKLSCHEKTLHYETSADFLYGGF